MRDPVLIHLHVPKCAGGAVNQVMRRHFGQRLLHASGANALKVLDEGENYRFDAVVGHLVWGLHTYFDRRAKYFSAVREPIERICSFFNFIHTEPRASLHRPLKKRLNDLNDLDASVFQALPVLGKRWGNAMCRTYTGMEKVSGMAWEDVWTVIERRMADDRLVVRDLDGIRDFLVAEGVHEGGPLPRQKVTRHDRFDDYAVARPAELRPATLARLRARNQHDLRLMDVLREAGHIAG